MKVIENNGLTLLMPESDDFVLYNILFNSYHEKVYLGKFDTVDNYREMHKSLQPNRVKDAEELQNIINNQESTIASLAEQLERLAAMIQNDSKK